MTDQPDLREEIAAYLAGDLDAARSSSLEGRMASEPWVAAEVDRMADLLVTLGGLDQTALPDGFSERLRDAIEEEVGQPLFAAAGALADSASPSAATAAPTPGSAAPAIPSGGAAPSSTGQVISLIERRDLRRRVAYGLGIAASMAVLAVGSLSVFSGSSDEAGNDTSVADAPVEEAAEGLRDGAEEDALAFDQAPTADADALAIAPDDATAGAAPSGDLPLTAEADAADGAEEAAGTGSAASAAAPAADAAAGSPTGAQPAQGQPADGPEADALDDSGGGAADDEAADESAPAPPQDVSAPDDGAPSESGDEAPTQSGDEAPAEPEDGAADTTGSDAPAADSPEPEPAPDPGAGPQVADYGQSQQDDAVARATQEPAVQRAKDTTGDRRDVAAAYRDEILRSAPFSDGVEPGQCLQDVLAGNDDDVIPAVAVRHVSDDEVRLSYVLVDPENAVRVWTVTASTCQVVAVVG